MPLMAGPGPPGTARARQERAGPGGVTAKRFFGVRVPPAYTSSGTRPKAGTSYSCAQLPVRR
jgi:hypothetical protein